MSGSKKCSESRSTWIRARSPLSADLLSAELARELSAELARELAPDVPQRGPRGRVRSRCPASGSASRWGCVMSSQALVR